MAALRQPVSLSTAVRSSIQSRVPGRSFSRRTTSDPGRGRSSCGAVHPAAQPTGVMTARWRSALRRETGGMKDRLSGEGEGIKPCAAPLVAGDGYLRRSVVGAVTSGSAAKPKRLLPGRVERNPSRFPVPGSAHLGDHLHRPCKGWRLAVERWNRGPVLKDEAFDAAKVSGVQCCQCQAVDLRRRGDQEVEVGRDEAVPS